MDADAPPAEDLAAAASPIAGRGLFTGVARGANEVVLELGPDIAGVADFGLLNHSCDPNLGWVEGHALAARRDIAAGEELTVDYSTALDDPAFVLWCHCGSTRCRQAVEGSDWQIPQLQARYAGWWAPRLAKLLADIRG